MRDTASMVDSNYHMEVHPPLAFHQGNCVCTTVMSMLKGPISADTDETDTVHLATGLKKSRTVIAVDTRVQHGFQLCCDPAWIILEHRAPKLPPSYKDETTLKTF